METLLQGRKADATNRIVGFSDSLNGIENYKVIFKYDIDPLKRRDIIIKMKIKLEIASNIFFVESLNGNKNHGIIFKFDIDPLKRRE